VVKPKSVVTCEQERCRMVEKGSNKYLCHRNSDGGEVPSLHCSTRHLQDWMHNSACNSEDAFPEKPEWSVGWCGTNQFE